MITPIKDVVNKICISLNLNSDNKTTLLDIIQNKIIKKEIEENIELSPEIIERLDVISNGNNKMKLFEDNHLNQYTANTIDNFKDLKYNIGKLQIMALVNKIQKSNDNSMILNTMLDALNSQVSTIGEIMGMKGGSNASHPNLDIYFCKYIKYKNKYLRLQNKN